MNKEYGLSISEEKKTTYTFRKIAKTAAAATLRAATLVLGPGDDITAATIAAVHHDSEKGESPAVLQRFVSEKTRSSKEKAAKFQGDITTQVVIWENKSVL